ncbi:CocE/NonD family hydrolase [Mameliella alba]|nr:CocE/NonD family hydrolase [Antarctobacter heliothermus]MBY6143162.1 CocE/NonD family hydrolase [Mameliella alba]MCA0953114.1 CocE/NonD family hydrolase [Mameliella alba]
MTMRPEPGQHRVTVTEHLWIPMPDGVRLAARLWLPEGAADDPVPAIVEYIPYRKTDMVRARDERNHPYFAANGYACLRIDMRGSGDSEGRMDDMYSAHELSDIRHAIDWIAARPWCNGRLGMFGTSWGGTASLQANIDAPEALKAIIAVCATHDRYEDDIHHKGGCLLTDTFEWGATLPAILGAPPTTNVGDTWKTMWQERLEALSFPVEAWVREEARGDYWRHGSVIHQADRLRRPVLAVGGWSDRYSNSVMSLVAERPDLVRGVVGPWGHHYPDHGHPGPAMGFQQLALQWWDLWLKGEGRKEDWPSMRAWLREYDPPADVLDERNGRWIETGAPQDHTAPRVWHLAAGGLSDDAAEGDWTVPSDLRIGQALGDTGYFGRFGGLPLDQRDDDALSLCFDSQVLPEDLILYGAGEVQLQVDAPDGPRQLALRLNDVAPDGTSVKVGLCLRNLALDEALDVPAQSLPAKGRAITVPFHTKAYRFRKGHKIRMALSASCWPMIWPSAEAGGLTVTAGQLVLPLFQGEPRPLTQDLPPALDLPEVKNFAVKSAPQIQRFQSVEDGQLLSGWDQPYSEVHYTETGTDFGYETHALHRVDEGVPASAQSRFEHRACYRRPDGLAEMHSVLTARCDAESYVIDGRLTADWKGERLADRHWHVTLPRRHS